jgi:UDP-glucose-4-epimerase GalE
MLLITGGAGYVGRHVARLIGRSVVALDDLRNSARAAIDPIPLLQIDLAGANVDWSRFEAVIHCAGSIEVSQSVLDPGFFWWNNVGAPARFFREALGKTLVFSSTAAVYGEPMHLPIGEDHPLNPINPYGRTKLAAEQMFADLGVKLTILRYFNCAGHDEDHRPETHLIPRVVRAAIAGEPVPVYGDGSHVRDYVHVDDLAEAHVRALETPGIFNLGSGRGVSVLEVIETARRVTGRKIEVKFEPPRPGDPKTLVADITRARRELGWSPKRTLEDIIASTYEWRKAHPDGYGR